MLRRVSIDKPPEFISDCTSFCYSYLMSISLYSYRDLNLLLFESFYYYIILISSCSSYYATSRAIQAPNAFKNLLLIFLFTDPKHILFCVIIPEQF